MTLPIAVQGAANAGGFTLTSGVLTAQILSNSELMGSALYSSALDQSDPLRREAVWDEVLRSDTFQNTHANLAQTLTATEAPEAQGTTLASFERGRSFLLERTSEIQQALGDEALGQFAPMLRAVLSEQPDLASGRLADWQAGGASAHFVQELQEYLTLSLISYRGWEDTGRLDGSQETAAVQRALKALYGTLGEHLYAHVQGEALRDAVTMESADLVGCHQDLSHLMLFAEFVRLQRRLQQTQALPGTADRIQLYWELRAVELEMAERNDFDGGTFQRMLNTLSQGLLNVADRTRLREFNQQIAQNQERPTAAFRLQMLGQIDYFYQRALSFPLQGETAAQRNAYYDVVLNLSGRAVAMGVSQRRLDAVIDASAPIPKPGARSLSDIRQAPHIVSPHDMPKEVQDILKATGHWDEVVQHVRRIVFTPQIESSDLVRQLVGSMPHGRAYFFDRSVVIATQTHDARSRSVTNLHPWRLAGLLIHEARGHLSLSREVHAAEDSDGRMMTNVPQERDAYAWEAQFYRDYLRVHGEKMDPAQLAELEEIRFNCETTVFACNLLLGIVAQNLDPKARPAADDSAYRVFGLTRDAMDWSAYPIRLRGLLGHIVLAAKKDGDDDELTALRKELRRRIEDLEELHQGRYEWLTQRTAALMGMLLNSGFFSKDQQLQFKKYLKEDVAEALKMVEDRRNELEKAKKLSKEGSLLITQLIWACGANLDPNQLYRFLKTFPKRIGAQKKYYLNLFGMPEEPLPASS